MAFASPILCKRATFDGSRTYVVGVVNVTPDSFSDGGRYLEPERAVAHGLELAASGADILDVGGESTRPGATPVDATVERERVVPVIAELARRVEVPISVDTAKPEVAEAALAVGADLVNDVSGHDQPALWDLCARAGAALVVGHWRRDGEATHRALFDEVARELDADLGAARRAGVTRLIADPGLGFGKTAAHNLELLARAGELSARLGAPVMVGPSRKRFLGALTGRPPAERDAATVGACVAAAMRGADFVRVHDVRAVRDALAAADAVRRVELA
jgi:dihydropteroate synthase